jgi:hypothetical protein
VTLVRVALDVPGPTGTTPAVGRIRATPTLRRTVGDAIVLPAPFTVVLVDGVATLDLDPTSATWAWRIDEQTFSVTTTRYVTVPDSETTLGYEDLTDVDPATLDPSVEPEAAWTVALDALATDLATLPAQANDWSETQTFDPDNGIHIGTKLMLKFTDGFFGQRLHLTGIPGGVPAIMPYMEVAPASDTGVGTDVGGAIAGYQLYRTPGGGGVPDREFLAIEASGDNGTLPGFKISPWASGTGALRPVAFWDGTHEVFRLHNAGGVGELRIGTSARLTYEDTGTTARTWSILQKNGTLGCQYRSHSNTGAVRPYTFYSKNSGTIAAPGAPGNAATLGDIVFGSIDSGTERTGGYIRATTLQTWAYTTAQGTKIGIATVPSGSATAQVQIEAQEPTADSETGMLLRVDKAGVRTLVRVEIGAADSGGPGKRALVIPN